MSDKPDFKAMARKWFGADSGEIDAFAEYAYEAGVAAERERCARVADEDEWASIEGTAQYIAAAIRSGK
jgi:hypothetical protein